MTELPPEVRAFLEQARREQPQLPAALRERVRMRIESALAPSTAAGKPLFRIASRHVVGASFITLTGATALTLLLAAPRAAEPARAPEPVSVPLQTFEPDAAPMSQIEVPVRRELPRAAPSTLAAELKLIDAAERALRDGEPELALQALRAHRKRFRAGQLAREREGLQTIAACLLRLPDAQARARSYLQAGRPALLAARIIDGCKLEVEP